VKDLLSLLRILDNPSDELAWFRVLRLLEGVGAATARRIMEELEVGDDPGAATPLARLLAAAPSVPEPARAEMAGLRRGLGDCAEDPPPPPGAQVDRLREWLAPVIRRRYNAPAARLGDLERLAEQAALAPNRGRFVADLTLDPPVSTGDFAGPPSLDDDWLVLSTVHSAKGGEWDVVHIIHAADGMFPSDLATGDKEALAEERRLFYVAVTRARDTLEIDVPLRYHKHRNRLDDIHSFAEVSRFLTEKVQALMDGEHVGSVVSEIAAATGDERHGVAIVDIMLADLWS
jgi:DNA helicase-2/ATP-dependent DNA helicase PcrA